MRFLFLIALGVAAWLIYKLYIHRLLAQGALGRIKIGMIALGFVFLALALTGRAPALFAVLGAVMTQAMRFGPLLVRFAPSLQKHFGSGNPFGADRAGGPGGGGSQVRTATILMRLDHATGGMDGEVLTGEHSGRKLSALTAAELVALHGYCRANDAEALRLLEAYVGRERAGEFDNASEMPGAGAGAGADAGNGARDDRQNGGSGPMSVHEAAEVLGLAPDADREAIMTAHRTLMSRLHPDKGGSDYLATKVNAARAALLDAADRS